MKFLIVDRFAFNTLIIEKLLRSLGYESVVMKSGYDAIKYLEESGSHINCIISNVYLSDMDGFRLYQECENLKCFTKYSILQLPPIIFLTPFHEEKVMQKAKEIGASAVFVLPFDGEEFKKAIITSVDPENEINHVSRLQILILDEHGSIYELVKRIYSNSSFKLVRITACYRCLEYLESNTNVVAIISDTNLPDMSFEKMYEILNETNKKSIQSISFVLLTSSSFNSSSYEALKDKMAYIAPLNTNHFIIRKKLDEILGNTNLNPSLPQYKILIVDDLKFNTVIVKNLLQTSKMLIGLDCIYITAACGTEALSVLESDFNIKLVVCDYLMPDFTGLELLKSYNNYLQRNKQEIPDSFKKPRFILFTIESAKTALESEARKHGFDDVFTKPLEATRFISRIESLLKEVE